MYDENLFNKTTEKKGFRNGSSIGNILVLLIFITIIQQTPFILANFYNEIRFLLYILFGISSVLAGLNKESYREKTVKYMVYVTIYVTIISIIPIIDSKSISFEGTIELLVPLGILLCSKNTKYSSNKLSNIIKGYVFLASLLGIYSIIYYDLGFIITQNYVVKSKNQIGPVIGISAIITMYNVVLNKKNSINNIRYKIFNNTLFVMLFLSLIIFRNRSSILGVIIVGVFMLIKSNKMEITYKKFLILNIIGIFLLIIYASGILKELTNFLWNSLTLNYNINDLNSLSAGRTDGYLEALKISIKNPLFGQLSNNISLEHQVHNYILNKWIKYGIFGSLPIIAFYIYLWKISLKGVFLNNKSNVVFYILLFSLIVSILEYTYPFGPGVSQIMLWFLLGQYLNSMEY